MALIGIVLLVLLVLSAIMLVLLVLVQDEQGEGVAGFFSGASTSAFGSRAGNVLTRFTTAIAAVFLFCCLALAWVNRSGNVGNVVGKAREQALSGETAQWWVESSAAGGAESAPEAAAGAAPAAEAPASGGQ